MLNCLNILQPSSGSEHICAMYCVLYTNIHMYIINVFSTYVFPNAFQTQLLLRHLFLLLRSCSDRKLLESDKNKPLSLCWSLVGEQNLPRTGWCPCHSNTINYQPQGAQISTTAILKPLQCPWTWGKSTQYTLSSVSLEPQSYPFRNVGCSEITPTQPCNSGRE